MPLHQIHITFPKESINYYLFECTISCFKYWNGSCMHSRARHPWNFRDNSKVHGGRHLWPSSRALACLRKRINSLRLHIQIHPSIYLSILLIRLLLAAAVQSKARIICMYIHSSSTIIIMTAVYYRTKRQNEKTSTLYGEDLATSAHIKTLKREVSKTWNADDLISSIMNF